MVTHFSQFIPVNSKKIVRKSQTRSREELRILRVMQNGGFLMKKTYTHVTSF